MNAGGDVYSASSASVSDGAMPKNVIVVLLDSLNRHLLGAYGASEFDTPNIDRLARRALRFERHFAGSVPCMPARHDILCGALDFLWKPWGSIEVWEEAITYQLRDAGVTTMLVTDHPHLFETGGENYHTDFSAWEYLRGHENDPWRTVPDPTWAGTPALPARTAKRHYDDSRTWFRSEEDFPGPKTMAAAASWLETSAGSHERFLLFVDEFDPHEPFDTPEPYASLYDPDWEGERVIWPPYTVDGVANGVLSESEARQVRANYGSKLTMIDHWFGKLLDVVDAKDLWGDTAVIVCTDHGHYLGERDLWGKPAVPLFEPLGHIPLLVAWPGRPPGVVEALSTSVDIHATLCEVFGVTPGHRSHGRSLVPLIEGKATSVRDWLLAGYWGRAVHVIDTEHKYARSPLETNLPLSMWSNRWSTMPGRRRSLPKPDRRATLDFMPGSQVPVIRQPFGPGDLLPDWARAARPDTNMVFDYLEDPAEEHNLAGTKAEVTATDLLRAALEDLDAPAEHFERLGLR